MPVNLRPSPWELAGNAKRSETWRIQNMYEEIVSCIGVNNVESIRTKNGQMKSSPSRYDLLRQERYENIKSMMAIVDENTEAEVRHNLKKMGYKPLSIHDSGRGVVLVFNQQSKV